MLNKEFKNKDVQRLRNIVKGKAGERTTSGVGYSKQQDFHNEGDVWEEGGRTWTIKNGIKQNLTKWDKAKKSVTLPLFCSGCKQLMNHKYDKLFYIQYKRCFNCQIEFETELRKLGLWEEYEKNIINSDIDNVTKDYNTWMDEVINSSNDSYVTEDGDVERWVGSSKKKLLEDKEETIKYLQSLKK